MPTSHDSETPAEGQQVITVCAFIWHEFDGVKKVFLPMRAKTKKFLPGVYELPGGHIEFGEEIKTGLAREIREEFGMSVVVGDIFYAHDYTNLVKKSHSVEMIYFVQFADDISRITINPEDHSEYGWFDNAEVQTIVAKNREVTLTSDSLEVESMTDPEVAAMLRGFKLLETDYWK